MGTERELYWTRRGVLACQSAELWSIKATQHSTCGPSHRWYGSLKAAQTKITWLTWGKKGKQSCQWVLQNAKERRQDCNYSMKRSYRHNFILYIRFQYFMGNIQDPGVYNIDSLICKRHSMTKTCVGVCVCINPAAGNILQHTRHHDIWGVFLWATVPVVERLVGLLVVLVAVYPYTWR